MKPKYLLCLLIALLLNLMLLQAQQWQPVSSGVNGTGVRAMYPFNGNLFLGGTFDTAGSVACNNIAMWNNNAFMPLGSGVTNSLSPEVISFSDYNGSLIVGGSFDSAGGLAAHQLATWNGTLWAAFAQSTIGSVNSLANYNGELWNGSDIDTSNGSGFYVYPAQWNGSQWSCKGSATGTISAMLNYNSSLYLGGSFSQIVPPWLLANRIVKWDGVNWAALGPGFNEPVHCLAEHNGELYAGGSFDSSGSQRINHIAKWNGNSWQSVGDGMNDAVQSMVSYRGELYAAGFFSFADTIPVSNIARWNGVTWAAVDSGFNNGVLCLSVFNNELYAGGWFTMSGNTPVRHIAKLDTTSLTGTNNPNPFRSISVYPNPFYNSVSISIQNPHTGKLILTVKNIFDQTVYSAQENVFNNTKTIDLGFLVNGIYFLDVNIDGERIRKKIVKD